MDNNRVKTVKWSDLLQTELCSVIGNFLDSRVDVVRFRSVCSIWRSSRPPYQHPSPPPPLPLCFSSAGVNRQALVFQSTTYLIQSIIDQKRWLVKFEEDPNSGKLCLLNPVTNRPLRSIFNSTSISLLDFRFLELRKSYVLKFFNHSPVRSVRRMVVMPETHLKFGPECAVFILYNEGKLGFMRFGDEKFTRVDAKNSHYDDIIVYKGQCYVIDKWGTISWLSSALQVIQFSPPLCGFGGHKHLVESGGDLYVVDQYFETVSYKHQRRRGRLRFRPNVNELVDGYHDFRSDADVVDIKVYKLDQEWGKWVNVTNLGDQVFILGIDGSFSVSTREFEGVNGNCIFFIERASIDELFRQGRVFNLEDGRFRNPAYLPLFSYAIYCQVELSRLNRMSTNFSQNDTSRESSWPPVVLYCSALVFFFYTSCFFRKERKKKSL